MATVVEVVVLSILGDGSGSSRTRSVDVQVHNEELDIHGVLEGRR